MSRTVTLPQLDDRVLSTLNADGTRRWMDPREVRGPWRRRRMWTAWTLIVLFTLLPWIRIDGKPPILLDVLSRKFTVFGATFRPTETALVAVVLGDQWVGIAALLPTLALAMLLLTLQILFAPATNAAGHPGVALRISIWGSILMPAACLVAMPWGLPGFAWAWVAAMAMLLAITMASSLPLLGLSARDVTMACLPQLAAGLAMGGLLWAIDGHVFWPTEPLRLCALVAGGLLLYPAILMLIAPERLREAVRLVGYGSMSANDNHSQED